MYSWIQRTFIYLKAAPVVMVNVLQYNVRRVLIL